MTSPENNELYETQLGRSVHISKRVGALAVGVVLIGASIAYYIARKAGSGVKNGAEFIVATVSTAVEHDYEDSAAPITIERVRKSS